MPTLHRDSPPRLTFPSADGVQPHQPCQWWYWSGQLRSERGRRFGFQLAMFAAEAVRGVLWGQMAHWAMIELDSARFCSDSRLWLGAPERVEGRFALTTPDGRARAHGGGGADRIRLQLPELTLDLDARGGPLVEHYEGRDHSYEFGGHSFYYSRPRMRGDGRIQSVRGSERVEGELWFDRQFGSLSSALVEGWEWLSIHLDAGEQLMVFGFNRCKRERFASITDAKGQTRWLGAEDFELCTLEHWQSPRSGIEYPCAWRLCTDRHQLELRACSHAQEMNGSRWMGPIYWEGACEVAGTHRGHAYAELLGSLRDPLAAWLRGERGPQGLREPIAAALLHPPVVLGLTTALGRGARMLDRLRPRFPRTRAETSPKVSSLHPHEARAWREAASQ